MPKLTDIHPTAATLYFLPVTTRVPLKFGAEILTTVTCARVALQVADQGGRSALAGAEAPLSRGQQPLRAALRRHGAGQQRRLERRAPAGGGSDHCNCAAVTMRWKAFTGL